MTVLIAGGGIAGLTAALTLHQIGVEVTVLEQASELRPLGVGINLQPNAVRELFDLGLEAELESIGIKSREWALVGRNGNDIWAEPRGLDAGYRWPQYSVHRGELQMMLYRAVKERLGEEAVLTDHRFLAYENSGGGVRVKAATETGERASFEGTLLLGADGLHSAVRRQMFPAEGDPLWAGTVLWRGTATGPPIRTGASFLLVGGLNQRFVTYPITRPDEATGLQVHNWIAELTFSDRRDWERSDWNRRANVGDFLPSFEGWNFDWLDVPRLVQRSETVYEYPMVDRDPAPTWLDGNVALMGDAAHVMYPTGSNGASQAIIDARVLGAMFLEHGVGHHALQAYEAALHADMSALILRNRGHGPVGILEIVEERCGGVFDNIEDVVSREEIESYMARYKQAAGFAIETLNSAPPTIDSPSIVR